MRPCIDLEGLLWWFSGKESACQAEDTGTIPGSERAPGEGNCNPLQYSCLENPMDRGAWQTTVHGVARVVYNLATKQQHRFRSKWEIIV